MAIGQVQVHPLHSSFLFAQRGQGWGGVFQGLGDTPFTLGGGRCSANGRSRARRRGELLVPSFPGRGPEAPRPREDSQTNGGSGSARPARRPGALLPAQPLPLLDSVEPTRPASPPPSVGQSLPQTGVSGWGEWLVWWHLPCSPRPTLTS